CCSFGWGERRWSGRMHGACDSEPPCSVHAPACTMHAPDAGLSCPKMVSPAPSRRYIQLMTTAVAVPADTRQYAHRSPDAGHDALRSRDAHYDALRSRDRRFDGVFFVGVSSTGIYCRPVCTARRPLARNCTFFRTAAEAEGSGYRPCLKCRPELAPGRSLADASDRLAR